jgi:hypothetical protein
VTLLLRTTDLKGLLDGTLALDAPSVKHVTERKSSIFEAITNQFLLSDTLPRQ